MASSTFIVEPARTPSLEGGSAAARAETRSGESSRRRPDSNCSKTM